jgi:hypothetical protein
MKKIYIILIIIGILIISWLFIRFVFGGGEDSWIKDEKGVYVRHGNPSETPAYVAEQQEGISCALSLYQEQKQTGIEFTSQCLGTCMDYAVDIVHVPRTNEDNIFGNQCSEYQEGKVSKFIELDKDGKIVSIIGG